MTDTAWLTGPPLDSRTEQWQLNKDDYLIGREAPADLIVPLSRISRRHARITRDEQGYAICDLGSRSGTSVNGQPIGPAPCRLTDGDQIVLGGVIALRFHDAGAAGYQPRLESSKGVWLDEAAREVWVDGRRVDPPLSAAQIALLALLHRSAGQVISRAQIVAAVWPDVNPASVGGEAIDALVKRLRARLRETQPGREYLEVLRSHKLRLIQPEHPTSS